MIKMYVAKSGINYTIRCFERWGNEDGDFKLNSFRGMCTGEQISNFLGVSIEEYEKITSKYFLPLADGVCLEYSETAPIFFDKESAEQCLFEFYEAAKSNNEHVELGEDCIVIYEKQYLFFIDRKYLINPNINSDSKGFKYCVPIEKIENSKSLNLKLPLYMYAAEARKHVGDAEFLFKGFAQTNYILFDNKDVLRKIYSGLRHFSAVCSVSKYNFFDGCLFPEKSRIIY